MAIVEEEIPLVLIQIPPASLLSTVPDPQVPPSPPSWSTPGTLAASNWDTCIIEEVTLEVRHAGIVPLEGHPPLSTAPDQGSSSAYRLSSDHLALIFYIHRDMEEQLHTHTMLNSRLDLIFDALSSTPDKRRCPTCAQSFIFTPTWQNHGDNENPSPPSNSIVFLFSIIMHYHC
jgi:hypothetical protein